MDTGLWSFPEPQCNEIFCLVPPSPDHGSVDISTGNIANGTTATVSCDNGFYYNLTENQITCVYGKQL